MAEEELSPDSKADNCLFGVVAANLLFWPAFSNVAENVDDKLLLLVLLELGDIADTQADDIEDEELVEMVGETCWVFLLLLPPTAGADADDDDLLL